MFLKRFSALKSQGQKSTDSTKVVGGNPLHNLPVQCKTCNAPLAQGSILRVMSKGGHNLRVSMFHTNAGSVWKEGQPYNPGDWVKWNSSSQKTHKAVCMTSHTSSAADKPSSSSLFHDQLHRHKTATTEALAQAGIPGVLIHIINSYSPHGGYKTLPLTAIHACPLLSPINFHSLSMYNEKPF